MYESKDANITLYFKNLTHLFFYFKLDFSNRYL